MMSPTPPLQVLVCLAHILTSLLVLFVTLVLIKRSTSIIDVILSGVGEGQ